MTEIKLNTSEVRVMFYNISRHTTHYAVCFTFLSATKLKIYEVHAALGGNFSIRRFTNPPTVMFRKVEKNIIEFLKKRYFNPPTLNIICFIEKKIINFEILSMYF